MPGRIRGQLLKGTTTLLVLTVLREGELYGYEIAQRIRDNSGGAFVPNEGSLYPALHAPPDGPRDARNACPGVGGVLARDEPCGGWTEAMTIDWLLAFAFFGGGGAFLITAVTLVRRSERRLGHGPDESV